MKTLEEIPGFTANSLNGNIVNNQLVTPPTVPSLAGPVAVVLALLLAALATLTILGGVHRGAIGRGERL